MTHHPLLVTGTDTGVGKTHVTRALLRTLVRGGHPTTPLKLIETGLSPGPAGELLPDDGSRLAAAAGWTGPLDVVAPVRLRMAAAPSTAARAEGVTLHFADLLQLVDRAARTAPRLVLEGAGGLLVPIGEDGTFRELASCLGARVLIVARNSLGTLNHTCLTVEAARSHGLVVLGVILNATGPTPDPIDHAHELGPLLGATRVLGTMPWLPDATDDALADAFERHVAPTSRILTWFE